MSPHIAPVAPEQSLNKSGQSMRRKGQDKYQRIVQATTDILRTQSVSRLKAADIARAAHISAPNFYLYFGSVLDAVLAAVEQVHMTTPEMMALLQAPWPDAELGPKTLAFVNAYLAHWQEQGPLLRVRSTLVAEGDERFRLAEQASSMEVLKALSAQFQPVSATAQPIGLDKVAPHAGVILAMLDRLAAYLPRAGVMPDNVFVISDDVLVAAAARNLAVSIAETRRGL